MTAVEHREHEPSGHPLGPGATPRTIAEALLPRDRAEFLAEYDRLMDEARRSRDLTEVHEAIEHWRGIAALQADPDRFHRAVRRAAELITGEPSPPDEPLERTRAKAGMQVAYEVDDSAVAARVAEWPHAAGLRFAEVRTVLSLTPWNSRPAHRDNPDGQFRFLAFSTGSGSGFVYFVILDSLHEVSIVDVIWHG